MSKERWPPPAVKVERLHIGGDGKIKQQRATPTLLNIAFTAFTIVARRRETAYESQSSRRKIARSSNGPISKETICVCMYYMPRYIETWVLTCACIS